MQLFTTPRPCPAGGTYRITATGGTSPYEFTLVASPPNPAGLTITVVNDVASVTIPAGTAQGTPIFVTVADSSSPPQTGTSTNSTS